MVWSYGSLRDAERAGTVLAGGIRLGTEQFAIMNGAECVGNLETTVYDDESFGVRAAGTIRARIGSEERQAQFDAQLLFNQFHQLSRFKGEVESLDSVLTLVTSNVHPINLALGLRGPGTQWEHTFTVPGPLIIARRPDLSYSIVYPHMQHGMESSIAMARGLTGAAAQLSFVRASPEEYRRCADDAAGRIDLSPLLARAQSVASAMEQTFGAAFPDLSHGNR